MVQFRHLPLESVCLFCVGVSGATVTSELPAFASLFSAECRSPWQSPVQPVLPWRRARRCSGRHTFNAQAVRGAGGLPLLFHPGSWSSDLLTLPNISLILFNTLSVAKPFWLWRKEVRRGTMNFIILYHVNTLVCYSTVNVALTMSLNSEMFSELL